MFCLTRGLISKKTRVCFVELEGEIEKEDGVLGQTIGLESGNTRAWFLVKNSFYDLKTMV